MTITDIQPQKSDQGRVSVFIGGKFFAGLSAERFYALCLPVNQPLTSVQIHQLEQAVSADAAWEWLEKSLSKTGQSEFRLRQKMIRKGFQPDLISALLEKARHLGWVNDEAYSRSLISDGKNLKGWGTGRLRQELKKRGIAEALIRDLLADEKPDPEVINRLAEKIRKKFSPLSDQGNQIKAARYLRYRGFSWTEIRQMTGNSELPSPD